MTGTWSLDKFKSYIKDISNGLDSRSISTFNSWLTLTPGYTKGSFVSATLSVLDRIGELLSKIPIVRDKDYALLRADYRSDYYSLTKLEVSRSSNCVRLCIWNSSGGVISYNTNGTLTVSCSTFDWEPERVVKNVVTCIYYYDLLNKLEEIVPQVIKEQNDFYRQISSVRERLTGLGIQRPCSDVFKEKFYKTGKTFKRVVYELRKEGYNQQDIVSSAFDVLANLTWDD